VPDGPRAAFPWLLVAASVLLAVLFGYTLFAAYLPARQRIAQLERELKDLYVREAELHTKVAQNEQRGAQRDRQLAAAAAERDAIARRLEDLERQLGVSTARRR
jgi:septal ring factor EnvC (AmiA/AmiB activator)